MFDAQLLAQQQKQRLLESERLNNDLHNRLQQHETDHQAKERQMQEREILRQQRQNMLDDYRKTELKKVRLKTIAKLSNQINRGRMPARQIFSFLFP